ncbi:MAG: hypothetical protein NT068_00220 [Candidatus Nomurabacteria bacterium]|nr:hypothetical protein [Candidatus Nomurabacteria bacterium]
MTIPEAKDFFLKSNFSDVAKSKIMFILDGKEEMTKEIFSEIKIVMQQELDNDFAEAGVDLSNDKEAETIKKNYDDKLEKIDTDLNEDMDFVEKELKEVEDLRKQVVQGSDEMEADKIRQSLQG